MAALVRIGLVVAMMGLVGGCDTNEGFADGATFRNVDINGPELNGPLLQGPLLQGPLLQGPLLQGIILNGPLLQGPLLQGPLLQGPLLQGPLLQGVVLNGPLLQGPLLQGPLLQGSELVGTAMVDGVPTPVAGADFVGSEWELRVEQVMPDNTGVVEYYVLRIDAVDVSSEHDDVNLYYVSARPKDSDPNVWRPLCADANNVALPAIPLQNYWNLTTGARVDDPNVFTFACHDGALAKCVEWGYRPWAEGTLCHNADKGKAKKCEPVSLKEYHQACTRMARADYCGDGTAWTVEGNAIDARDFLTPPVQSETTDWTLEAEWNPNGAYCVDDIRQQTWKAEGRYPACFLDKKGKPKLQKDCGSLKNERALIYSTFDLEAQKGKID